MEPIEESEAEGLIDTTNAVYNSNWAGTVYDSSGAQIFSHWLALSF